jgi:hypothetical protein
LRGALLATDKPPNVFRTLCLIAELLIEKWPKSPDESGHSPPCAVCRPGCARRPV